MHMSKFLNTHMSEHAAIRNAKQPILPNCKARRLIPDAGLGGNISGAPGLSDVPLTRSFHLTRPAEGAASLCGDAELSGEKLSPTPIGMYFALEPIVLLMHLKHMFLSQ
jgi:hypothetical protein